jgi:hemolysin activation/secretion protein
MTAQRLASGPWPDLPAKEIRRADRCMQLRWEGRPLAACAAAILAAVCGAAWGQQRPDAGTILEQQRERVPLPAPKREVLPATPPPPALSAPALRVQVTEFRVSGNSVLSQADLLAVVREFVGKELDFNGLNEAAERIRSYYRARGYFLAQAYLPAQQISGGVVEIAVLEGQLGKVDPKLTPGSGLRESFVRGVLEAHLAPGAVITETGLERPLLLLSDLPGISVSSDIGPSRETVGAADLQVNIERDPRETHGYVDFDNGGSRFTGQVRPGVSATASNFTGYGDQASFRGFISNEHMHFGRIAYVIPLGYGGTRVGATYTGFDYRLAKDFAALEAHGKGSVTSLHAFHPLMRTRNANFIFQAAVESKNLTDQVDTTASVEERRIRSVILGGVGDFRDGAFGGGLSSYGLSWTKGKLTLDPPALLAADQAAATGLQTAGDFNKTNADFRRLQRITENLNLEIALTAQAASKNLASAEKFSLGGPSGVRGYPVGEATGDSGYVANAELRYIVPGFKLLKGDITGSLFYDTGRIRTDHAPLATSAANDRALAAWGLGVSVGRERDFFLKATLATRAAKEKPTSDSAAHNPMFWIQAIKWF